MLIILFIVLSFSLCESITKDSSPLTLPSSSSSSSAFLTEERISPDVGGWNFTQWWFERSDVPPLQSEVSLVFEEPNKDLLQQYSDLDKFDYVQYGHSKNVSQGQHVVITSLPIYIDKSSKYRPATTIEKLNETIMEFFSRTRYWADDKEFMRDLRESLKERFLSYGLKTAFHIFKAEDTTKMLYPGETRRQTAANIIAVLPGLKRGTPDDEIIVVGAHYDTVKKSPGIDDNGSGSAAVLEIARLLTTHRCQLNKTVIFTLFDLEEEYLKGSKYFVHQYLMPTEIVKNKAKFRGAYIMDMLLAYNYTNGSQSTRDFLSTLPVFAEEVKDSGSKGDFLTVWSRRNIDQDLFFFLEKNWNGTKYPLRLMDPPLPTLSHEVARDWNKYSKYGTFARSDHASFWYPLDREKTFNAVLLSDLGPWRRDMMYHYHRPSDDHRWLTYQNLDFMKNTVDSLLAALLDLGEGRCFIRRQFN